MRGRAAGVPLLPADGWTAVAARLAAALAVPNLLYWALFRRLEEFAVLAGAARRIAEMLSAGCGPGAGRAGSRSEADAVRRLFRGNNVVSFARPIRLFPPRRTETSPDGGARLDMFFIKNYNFKKLEYELFFCNQNVLYKE